MMSVVVVVKFVNKKVHLDTA